MVLCAPLQVDVARDWLDYAALVVSFLAAGGTLIAVLVSVSVARNAARDRRREQAARVTAWPGSMDDRLPSGNATQYPIIVVRNGSGATIHNVLVGYAGAWGSLPPDRPHGVPVWKTMIPPGDWYLDGPEYEGEAMDFRTGLLIEFTDANGWRWKRAADGALSESNGKLFQWMHGQSKPDNSSLTMIHD